MTGGGLDGRGIRAAMAMNDQKSPQPAAPVADAATEADAAPAARPYHLFPDLFRGIFQGAYAADDMHTPGLLAWIVVGFIPVFGTLAAARDAYYCLEAREWGGLLLNLVGFLPFMKGFATVIEVTRLHRVHRVAHMAHQSLHVARRGRHVRTGAVGVAAAVTGLTHEAGALVVFFGRKIALSRNGAAWPALLLALITAFSLPAILGLVLDVFATPTIFGSAVSPALAVGIGAAACLASLGVLLLGSFARRAAIALRGRPFSRGFVAGTAYLVAWLGFLLTLLMTAFVVYAERRTLPFPH